MLTFFVVCYIISLSLSVFTLITGIIVGINRLKTVRILPRALRLYLLICGIPYFFLSSLCSIYIAAYFLLYNSLNHFSVELARNFSTFSSQQIRNTFILILFERIIATIKLEKYTMSESNILLWRLTSSSYAISILYFGYNAYVKTVPEIPLLYNILNYYAYAAHLFMLCVCAILFLMNRRMYKLSAYKITLKRRYTIAQNIKVITYLFPSIIIYSILGQFGSMITIFFLAFNLPAAPISVYHIFFNLSFLFIYLRHYFIQSDKIINGKAVTMVKNALGKNIPTNVTTDKYFHDLQHLWI